MEKITEYEVCTFKTSKSKKPKDAKRYFSTLEEAVNFCKNIRFHSIKEVTYDIKLDMLFYNFGAYYFKSF